MRGSKKTIKENSLKNRNAVIKILNYQTILACYRSPEYQKAFALGKYISLGHPVIIEGTNNKLCFLIF